MEEVQVSMSEQVEEWNTLLRCKAWKWLESILQQQAAGRVNQILLQPLTSADDVFQQEFMKGEVASLRLVPQLPALEIERLKQDIQTKLNEDGLGDSYE